MPHINVKLYSGRNAEQKQALADALTKTMMSVLGSKEESISVGIEDVAPDAWADTVNKPEILDKPDTVYKRPGPR